MRRIRNIVLCYESLGEMAQSYEFLTALRSFHVYSNTGNWRPYVGQKIPFEREHSNPHDRFVVAGNIMFEGKIAPVTVGHVPRELVRNVWYAIMEGEKFEAFSFGTSSPGRLLYDLEQIATEMKSSDHVYSFNSEEHTKSPRNFLKWNTPFIAILDWGVPNGSLQGPKCNSAE